MCSLVYRMTGWKTERESNSKLSGSVIGMFHSKFTQPRALYSMICADWFFLVLVSGNIHVIVFFPLFLVCLITSSGFPAPAPTPTLLYPLGHLLWYLQLRSQWATHSDFTLLDRVLNKSPFVDLPVMRSLSDVRSG